MTIDHAILLMEAFLDRTGVTSDAENRRYLWTDAFAVSNLLDLGRRTGQSRYCDEAEALIAQVHGVLGRHRPDDSRQGWLSGLPEDEGALRPTAGGLRIGKPLPERHPDEPMDERLEWERDGQYFHYLTKWMTALGQASTALAQPRYQAQAVELAEVAFRAFLQRSRSGMPQGLAWKMSIDLSRPLLPGQSPHDVLDGYVTFKSLVANESAPGPLGEAVGVLWTLSQRQSHTTADPLGLGGLLMDVARLAELPRAPADDALAARLLAEVRAGLDAYLSSHALEGRAEFRLAFRELGLAIGLRIIRGIVDAAPLDERSAKVCGAHAATLGEALRIAQPIIEFWRDPGRQRCAAWRDHRDINEVMLATAMLAS